MHTQKLAEKQFRVFGWSSTIVNKSFYTPLLCGDLNWNWFLDKLVFIFVIINAQLNGVNICDISPCSVCGVKKKSWATLKCHVLISHISGKSHKPLPCCYELKVKISRSNYICNVACQY